MAYISNEQVVQAALDQTRGTYLYHYCTPLGNSAASRQYLCVEPRSYSRDGISCTAVGEARIVLKTVATGWQHWCRL